MHINNISTGGGGIAPEIMDAISSSRAMGEMEMVTLSLNGALPIIGEGLSISGGRVLVSVPGVYMVSAAINWRPQTSAYRADIVQDKNGSGTVVSISVPPSSDYQFHQETTYVKSMAENDTFALRGRNFHTGGLSNITGSLLVWRVA